MTDMPLHSNETAIDGDLNEPDIAYVVPVHNGAKYLEAALTSLAEQTLAPSKVYIFENCSTDETVKIAQKFVQRYPNFELHPASEFLSAKENFDRAYAYVIRRHEFFAALAHDDVLAHNFVEVLYGLLVANPKALLAVSNVIEIGSSDEEPIPVDTNILRRESYRNPVRGFKRITFPASWYYGLYRGRPAFNLMQDSISNFPHLWAGDRMVVLHFLLRGSLVYSPKTHFRFRPGSDSFRAFAEKRALGMLRRRVKYHFILWSHRRFFLPLTLRAQLAYWSLCYHTAARDTYRLEPFLLGKYRKLHRRK